MKTLNEKREYVIKLAKFLVSINMRMSGKELAINLNNNGFRTSYGQMYRGERGTYTLLSCLYQWLINKMNDKDSAETIAIAFVNSIL